MACPPAKRSATSGTAVTHRSSLSAFTLIEVLVSIAVVAILIAILVPALASARQNAKTTVSLATHAQLFTAT